MMNNVVWRLNWGRGAACGVLALAIGLCTGQASGLTLVPQALRVGGQSVTLSVPQGMQVDFVASASGARFPALGPDGELLVGSNGSTIYRLGFPYLSAATLVNIGSRSHSVAWDGSRLLVADSAALYAASYSGMSSSLVPGDFTSLVSLPTGGHSSRTVVVDSEGDAYVSIGISGNCSDEYLAGTSPDYSAAVRRGGVWKIDESGASPALVPWSSGLRNPIGIAFNPANGDLWATNAGSDDLGFDLPREIFSRLSEGSCHGMPWFQYISGNFAAQGCIGSDPPRPGSEATPPSVTFDARSTPQGIAFITGNQLDPDLSGHAVVAIHGSWARDDDDNQRPPKLVLVRFENGDAVSVEDMVTGFQAAKGNRFARPSGVVMGADGVIYFTSDGGAVQGVFRLRPMVEPPDPGPPQSFCVPVMKSRTLVMVCDELD